VENPGSDTRVHILYRAYQHVPKKLLFNPPFSSLVGWSQAAKMAAMREREEALEMKVLGFHQHGGFGCELEYLQIEDTDEPLSVQ